MKTIREFVQSNMTEHQRIESLTEYEICKITGKIRPSSVLLEAMHIFRQQHKDIAETFKDNAELMDRFALELYRCLALRYISTLQGK